MCFIKLIRPISTFKQTASSYQELLNRQVTSGVEMAIAEGQLTWLVYIIGSAIDGKKTFMSNDENDVIDGELILRVSRPIPIY